MTNDSMMGTGRVLTSGPIEQCAKIDWVNSFDNLSNKCFEVA